MNRGEAPSHLDAARNKETRACTGHTVALERSALCREAAHNHGMAGQTTGKEQRRLPAQRPMRRPSRAYYVMGTRVEPHTQQRPALWRRCLSHTGRHHALTSTHQGCRRRCRGRAGWWGSGTAGRRGGNPAHGPRPLAQTVGRGGRGGMHGWLVEGCGGYCRLSMPRLRPRPARAARQNRTHKQRPACTRGLCQRCRNPCGSRLPLYTPHSTSTRPNHATKAPTPTCEGASASAARTCRTAPRKGTSAAPARKAVLLSRPTRHCSEASCACV